MTRSFSIATTRFGLRWWWVRIYPTVEQMRAAAAAYHPGVDFSECLGCCQQAVWLDHRGRPRRFGARGYSGVLRFAAPHLTSEVVTHELVHAAVAVYRMQVDQRVDLGDTCTDQEEMLAYIYGELYADFEQHFTHPRVDSGVDNAAA